MSKTIRTRITRLAATIRIAADALLGSPITVDQWLTATHGLTGGVLRSVRGTFGKRVKAAHIALYGRKPRTVKVTIVQGGKEIQVDACAYSRRDEALFAQVWGEFYAN